MKIKSLLKKTGLIESLWDTPVYSIYRKILRKQGFDSSDILYDFYRRLISDFQIPQTLWFDVGANIGSKAAVFSKFARRVVAFEPDPNNALILRRRFRFRQRLTILEVAVGAHSGKALMTVGGGAYSTLAKKQREIIETNPRYANLKNEHLHSMEVGVVSLDELIIQFGLPDYIKVDVEGYEEAVIKGLSQPVSLISFESNLPDFEEETVGCIKQLASISKHSCYNFTTSEPPKVLSSKSWLSQEEIIEVVKNRSHHYMEIFSRSA